MALHDEPTAAYPPADGPDASDDPRLLQAVQDYMAELESGRRPQRQEFLRRHPDIAAPLAQCLDGLELIHQTALLPTAVSPSAIKAQRPFPGPEGLSTSPGGTTAGDTANPLGDFQIVREIGRGGMGIVYEARQLSLGRRVALKVLPFAATLDARHLQRFQNEASAAAKLHHTNIVPVYAVGCERGVHFYAMQMIDGQSLAAVIDHLRVQNRRADLIAADRASQAPLTQVDESSSDAIPPGRSTSDAHGRPAPETVSPLSLAMSTQRCSKPRDFHRGAARLLVQAAEALEHAHQYGIVHRDIKPANLLVDAHGRLWITDFGLAMVHTDANMTQTGDLVGTLRYMSPEQASGQRLQLDHRTDIYSLGATLYELVTLEQIFDGKTRQELLHQITHDEPRAPRSLAANVPVELETIILKAVSKHPADRYASARAFADDLQRFLDDKPILARRPTLFERARKWARRHPSLVAAGMLLLVVCLAALLVNNWMIAREQAKTAAALKSETQRATEARRAVDLLVDVAEQEMAEHQHLQNVRKRLLETALGYYQHFIETHGNDPGSRAELKAGENRVRSILDELATLQGANLLGLAVDKAVQEDMKLNEAQRRELAELNEMASKQRWEHFRDQRTLVPEVRRQKFYELAKVQEAGLSEILLPKELRRLRQIELQLQGPRAFHDSVVVDALKLAAEQKRKIRDIKDEMISFHFPGPPGKGGPAGFGKQFGPPQLEKTLKLELERIVAVLTPEQLAVWQEMIGPPFEGAWRMRFGPRQPFGPGAPGGPPGDRKFQKPASE